MGRYLLVNVLLPVPSRVFQANTLSAHSFQGDRFSVEENDSLPGTVSILPRSKHLITAIEFRFATTIRLPPPGDCRYTSSDLLLLQLEVRELFQLVLQFPQRLIFRYRQHPLDFGGERTGIKHYDKRRVFQSLKIERFSGGIGPKELFMEGLVFFPYVVCEVISAYLRFPADHGLNRHEVRKIKSQALAALIIACVERRAAHLPIWTATRAGSMKHEVFRKRRALSGNCGVGGDHQDWAVATHKARALENGKF